MKCVELLYLVTEKLHPEVNGHEGKEKKGLSKFHRFLRLFPSKAEALWVVLSFVY